MAPSLTRCPVLCTTQAYRRLLRPTGLCRCKQCLAGIVDEYFGRSLEATCPVPDGAVPQRALAYYAVLCYTLPHKHAQMKEMKPLAGKSDFPAPCYRLPDGTLRHRATACASTHYGGGLYPASPRKEV